MPKTDPRVTKRRVTMRAVNLDPATGNSVVTEAVDYVRPDFLEEYVRVARLPNDNGTPGWQFVGVSDEPDAGPGGYHGQTFVPPNLQHDLAGQVFEASTEEPTALWVPSSELEFPAYDIEDVLRAHREIFGDTEMVSVETTRNSLVDHYKTLVTHFGLFTSAGPYTTAGTEPSGGSPAYARQAANWGATSASSATASPTAFNVPSGANIQGGGGFSAITGGTFRDGGSLTSQNFASQGTYTLTATYTQT
jgi:hypothetical protein